MRVVATDAGLRTIRTQFTRLWVNAMIYTSVKEGAQMAMNRNFPLRIRGVHGSPYSLKMRAVLRYRNIPFKWVPQSSRFDDLPPFPLVPVIAFPDESGDYSDAMMDSSPQIARLEAMQSERSLVPTDPVVAFLDFLFEDFADEWITKQMYHFRWYYDSAIKKAGKLLPLDSNQQIPQKQWESFQQWISERQIGRRALVGSTEQNKKPIEDSYDRVLDLLQAHLANSPFLFGDRPGRGDFGFYGQLSQLVLWDPVSVDIAIERAPRVVNWTNRTDDLSWWDVDGDNGWNDRDSLAPTALAFLPEIGRTYAPFLLANEAAMEAGAETLTCVIDGNEYSQGTFVYQRKCLQWLREEYAKLSADDRQFLNTLLVGTGVETLFV
jgi:glutathione S-transferase